MSSRGDGQTAGVAHLVITATHRRLHVEHAGGDGERRDDHLERMAGAKPAVQLEHTVQHLGQSCVLLRRPYSLCRRMRGARGLHETWNAKREIDA